MFEIQGGSSNVNIFNQDVGIVDEHGIHEIVFWLRETWFLREEIVS